MQDFMTEKITVYAVVVVARRTNKALCSDRPFRNNNIRSSLRFFNGGKWSLTSIAMCRGYISSNKSNVKEIVL